MLFDKNGLYLALDHIAFIDTVFIEGKKFIPQGEVFYEVALSTPAALYVQHKHAYTLPAKDVGYAGTSQSSATESFSKLLVQGQFYNFDLPPDIKLSPKTQLWLMKESGYIKVTDIKSIEAAFPGKNAKKLAKDLKTDFKKPEDVIKLIQAL